MEGKGERRKAKGERKVIKKMEGVNWKKSAEGRKEVGAERTESRDERLVQSVVP